MAKDSEIWSFLNYSILHKIYQYNYGIKKV